MTLKFHIRNKKHQIQNMLSPKIKKKKPTTQLQSGQRT